MVTASPDVIDVESIGRDPEFNLSSSIFDEKEHRFHEWRHEKTGELVGRRWRVEEGPDLLCLEQLSLNY